MNCAKEIAATSQNTISASVLPQPDLAIYQPDVIEDTQLQPRIFRGHIRTDWRISSFSSLTINRGEELPDYDALSENEKPSWPAPLSGIFAFPRGAKAGSCLHKMLEKIDFQRPEAFSEIVGNVLQDFGFSTKDFGPCLTESLVKVVSTPLGKENFTFSQIAKANCLAELEFHFPIAHVTPGTLAGHFAKHHRQEIGAGWPKKMEKLEFNPTRGFLKGFIDLVFQHDGKFYIVDWKSNWLGAEAAAYHSKAIHAEMLKHCYFLQYHLYSVALHRYLGLRLPGYDFEKHFGGVFYIFVRGAEPKLPASGIFTNRPSREMVEGLSELFNHRGTERQRWK
jgi:exodeoxyribonuclease V beta subunit